MLVSNNRQRGAHTVDRHSPRATVYSSTTWPPHLGAVGYAPFRLTKDICNWLLLRCGAPRLLSRLLSPPSKFTGAIHAHTGLPSMERPSCSTQCIPSIGSVQSTMCSVSTQLPSSQSHVVALPCARIWHAAPLSPTLLLLLACSELARAGDGACHPLMRSISIAVAGGASSSKRWRSGDFGERTGGRIRGQRSHHHCTEPN